LCGPVGLLLALLPLLILLPSGLLLLSVLILLLRALLLLLSLLSLLILLALGLLLALLTLLPLLPPSLLFLFWGLSPSFLLILLCVRGTNRSEKKKQNSRADKTHRFHDVASITAIP
jgi:membrane protein implicated in regulation of membrane protease activity